MNQFTAKYAESIRGVLSGFDRLVFRGYLRGLSYVEGMYCYLSRRKVLLKDFGDYAQSITDQIKAAVAAPIIALNRPVRFLASAQTSKEETAQRIAMELGITVGPICLLNCVEPCIGYDVYRNKEEQKLQIVRRVRKCLHLYRYEIHPIFGFMHIRIQTWFPFNVQICINGREWLARQMDAQGIGYERKDNCFLDIDDFERAQELMDAQSKINWTEHLNSVLTALNPIHEQLFGDLYPDYNWSTHQSEWATDIVFGDPDVLRRLYPMLIRHGMTALGSPDVMRFLGRKIGAGNRIHGRYEGEVTSDIKTRQEGVRIKHRVDKNSVKGYDKAYGQQTAVLRAEMTMNNGADFRVLRPKEGNPQGPQTWRTLRKGTDDLHRRGEVCQGVNDRYLDALASVDDSTTLGELADKITKPTTDKKSKRVRALRPFAADDAALLAIVSRGEFTLNGLRNRDIVRLLYGTADAVLPQEAKRRSRRVTRQLRMLRAHGLIEKIEHTHRYLVTDLGRQVITAVVTAQHASTRQLSQIAA